MSLAAKAGHGAGAPVATLCFWNLQHCISAHASPAKLSEYLSRLRPVLEEADLRMQVAFRHEGDQRLQVPSIGNVAIGVVEVPDLAGEWTFPEAEKVDGRRRPTGLAEPDKRAARAELDQGLL